MATQLNLFTRRKAAKLPPATEFATHCMIADMLARWVSPGWRYTHIASGEFRTKATAGRLKRMGVKPGWPDFILLSPEGRPHFLELKRKGNTLTDEQASFAAWCHERRVVHVVAYSFNDAVDALKQWGAVRVAVAL